MSFGRANEILKARQRISSGRSSTASRRVDRVHRCWRGLDDVEFATMTYVGWFKHRRLHGENTNDAGYATPAEAEAAYYRQTGPAIEAMTKSPEQSRGLGRFSWGQAVRGAPFVWVVRQPLRPGLTHGGSVVRATGAGGLVGGEPAGAVLGAVSLMRRRRLTSRRGPLRTRCAPCGPARRRRPPRCRRRSRDGPAPWPRRACRRR